MKEGWEYKTLGECCRITDFVSNGSFASLKQNVNYYYSPNYALLVRLADNSNNFDESKFVYTDKHGYDFTSKSHLNGGEIIMSNVGSVGSVFICPDLNMPMTLAPNTISIDTEYNKFYYYLFISPSFSSTLSEIVTKTTLKKFNKTNFKKLIVRVPTLLEEQRRIVSYLDSSFKLIDEIKEKAQKSLLEAKALFQSALAEAMEPKEGWEEKTLGEISEIKGGKRVPKGFKLLTEPTNHKYIRVADFNDFGSITLENIQYISDEVYNQIKRYTISSEDVYISIAGTIGKSGIIPKELEGANLTENACKLVLDSCAYKYFVYYFTKSTLFLNQIKKLTMVSAQPKLALTRLATVNIPLPPLSTQKQIVSHLDKLSSNVKQMEEKYQKMVEECDALKQAMLRDVFE